MEDIPDSPARNTRSNQKVIPLSPTTDDGDQCVRGRKRHKLTPIPDKCTSKRLTRVQSASRLKVSERFNEIILESRYASRSLSQGEINKEGHSRKHKIQLSESTLNKLKAFQSPHGKKDKLTSSTPIKAHQLQSVSPLNTCELSIVNVDASTVADNNLFLNLKQPIDDRTLNSTTGIGYLTCNEHIKDNTHSVASDSDEEVSFACNRNLVRKPNITNMNTDSQTGVPAAPTLPQLPLDATPTETALFEMLKHIHVTIQTLQADQVKGKTSTEEMKKEIEQVKIDATNQSTKVEDLELKVETQAKIIERMQQAIYHNEASIIDIQNKTDDIEYKTTKGMITINGLPELVDENSPQLALNFFYDVMLVEETIRVHRAFRVGEFKEGYTRPMCVELTDPGQKGLLFKYVSNLSGKENERGEAFKLDDMLVGNNAEKQRRIRDVKKENSKTTVADRLYLTTKKGTLYVNSFEFKAILCCPMRSKVTNMSIQRATELQDYINNKLKQGNKYEIDGSTFIGYSMDADNIDEINDAYMAIRREHMEAKHIVCAFRLPGKYTAQLQHYEDDGEIGSGRRLLYLMKDYNQMNRAVFVVRYYRHHIGPVRFVAYKNAASSAIAVKPYNDVRKEFQQTWDIEEMKPRGERTQAGRGRGRGRGRGNNRNRGRGRGRGSDGNNERITLNDSRNLSQWNPQDTQSIRGARSTTQRSYTNAASQGLPPISSRMRISDKMVDNTLAYNPIPSHSNLSAQLFPPLTASQLRTQNGQVNGNWGDEVQEEEGEQEKNEAREENVD